MGYTSGTAANYKDLLAVLATFAAANGWTILEQSESRVYLKGTGLAGLDEIYCGVETYEDPPNNRYNWNMAGAWGYRAGRAISAQPMNSITAATSQVVSCFWNAPIPYWMVANGRRIIVFAKVGTTYQSVYLGLITPPATDAQYPYPLLIGGAGNSLLANYSAGQNQFWGNGYVSGMLSLPGGLWGQIYTGSPDMTVRQEVRVRTFNEVNRLLMLTGLDGSYLLEPLFIEASSGLAILGQIEGLYRVTGYNNTSENIITVDGINYMVFQDGSKAGYGDYVAMRLN